MHGLSMRLGAPVSPDRDRMTPMKSRLATGARAETEVRTLHLTPEQRLNAFLQHNQLIALLYSSGRKRPALKRRAT
jgi:hypothetical protein